MLSCSLSVAFSVFQRHNGTTPRGFHVPRGPGEVSPSVSFPHFSTQYPLCYKVLLCFFFW